MMEELDDIERVLDHAETWELTDEEILEASRVDMFNEDGIVNETQGYLTGRKQVATAAIQKYQEWLVKQCGENPCIGCEAPGEDACREVIGMCAKWHFWHGTQAGLAKGLAQGRLEMGKMEAKRPGDASPDWSASLPPSSPYPERGEA